MTASAHGRGLRRRGGGMPGDSNIDLFVSLSAVLTGFAAVDLEATGVAPEYWAKVNAEVAPPTVGLILKTWAAILATYPGDLDAQEKAVGAQMWRDPQMGWPLQSITVLWYVSTWFDTDQEKDYGTLLSGAAYQQGLVWPAIGTKPLGTRPLGYGSWSLPPAPPPVREGAE